MKYLNLKKIFFNIKDHIFCNKVKKKIKKLINNFYIIDAFTSEPFKGNPATVFICNDSIFNNSEKLQKLANEFNHSETAFLLFNNKMNNFKLRWFTPTSEVNLCGHATLASSAFIFYKKLALKNRPIIFYTKDFVLKANFINSKNNLFFIELNFPLGNYKEYENDDIYLLDCFNIKPKEIYHDSTYYLLIFENEKQIIDLNPNFELMNRTKRVEFICTAPYTKDDKKYDFVSRFFAPAIGIKEDPVTGSAHTYLANYWSKKLNKNKLTAYQASEREGVLYLEIKDKNVYIKGYCTIIATGKLIGF